MSFGSPAARINSRTSLEKVSKRQGRPVASLRTIGPVRRSAAIGVTEQSYYRWRREYGGLRTDQARRLKELERENARLRKAVAELTLDKLILKEAASGNS